MEDRSQAELEKLLRKHESIIYVAGLIDGEGCLGLWRSRKYFQPALLISNTDLKTLRRVKRILGFGRIVRKRTAYEYQVYRRAHVKRLLTAVYPYLTVKQAEARLLLEAIETRSLERKRRIAVALSGLKRKHKEVVNYE
jgi:hypothetical protein